MNLHPQGDLQGDPVRPAKVTAERPKNAATRTHTHTWGTFRSKMKESVMRMRFIHLHQADHQTDVAAEVLVRQRERCREGEMEEGKRERR